MPRLAKILTEADLLLLPDEGQTDLTPYIEIIEEVVKQGGVGGEVQLSSGENQRTSPRQIGDIGRHLAATFRTADAAEAWLHDPNRYLGGATPSDMIRSGRLDRVEAALTVLDSGIFI